MSLGRIAGPLAKQLKQAVSPALQQTRSFAKVPTAKGSQLENMPEPVKNFWEAPKTPYQWKHSHQYGLIAAVGGSFFYGLYQVMLNQRSGGAGGGVKTK